MLPVLDDRDRQPELMDQPGLDERVHHDALNSLGRVNWISRILDVLWHGLRDVVDLNSKQPIRVLDIGSGGGDLAIGLAMRAAREGVALEAHGCDVSPLAVAHARQEAKRRGVARTQFFPLDVLREPLPEGYDVLMCTLFLHHFAEPDALDLLRRMGAAARRGVLIDDLIRTRLGYALAWVGGRLLTTSPLVHTDGPLSVRAAFRLDEIRELAERAGLHGATIRTHWPQRFLFAWRKP